MKNNERNTDIKNCIHCNICMENCSFLKKYGINISHTEQLEELAYHCFLCGTCSRVCPKGIDGRKIIYNIRQQKVQGDNGKLKEKGYGMLLREKERYLFKNYRHIKAGSVLFPGCNFPSFYPKTTKHIFDLLNQYNKTGLVFDCCGKPIDELGKKKESDRIIKEINNRLAKEEVRELIVICPNCYYFLQSKVDVKVISIYEKLAELGLENKIIKAEIPIFVPCPDRDTKEWFHSIEPFLSGEAKILQDVQCCGLGGCAGVKEPEISKGFGQKIRQKELSILYTYCGTCGGSLSRAGCNEVRHIASDLLGVKEAADIRNSFINRIKTKYI